MNFLNVKNDLSLVLKDMLDITSKIRKCRYKNKSVEAENMTISKFWSNNEDEFKKICSSLETNLKAIRRQKMKCVVFGHTSNGKSAVLNALLGKRFLPSKPGVVTSCFVCIEGCRETSGYILGENGEKHSIDDIKKYADDNSETKYDVNSVLKVFLPSSSGKILSKDVEIWDSPGVDFSITNDDMLIDLCRSSDVFLLIIDANGTLNESEKKVFLTLQEEKIPIPIIIFVINKWDTIDGDDEDIKMLRKQHIAAICKFMSSLGFNDHSDIEKRIFFISAKNILGNVTNDKEGMESFHQFEQRMMNDLSVNGIERKLKATTQVQHILIKEVIKFLNSFQENILEEINFIDIENMIDQTFAVIETKTEMIVNNIIPNFVDKLKKSLDTKIKREELKKIDDDTLVLLKSTYPKTISEMFSTEIQSLQSSIEKFFMNVIGPRVDNDSLKVYFQEKHDIETRLDDEITRESMNITMMLEMILKKDQEGFWNTILRRLRMIGEFLNFVGPEETGKKIMKKFMRSQTVRSKKMVGTEETGIDFKATSPKSQTLPPSKSKSQVSDLASAFQDHYMDKTKTINNKMKKKIIKYFNQSVNLYNKSCREILEYNEIFQDHRIPAATVSNRLSKLM